MTVQGGCCTTVVVQNDIQIHQQKTEKGLPLYAIISMQNEPNPFLCHPEVLEAEILEHVFFTIVLLSV